jgi:hypothetical protein
MQSAQLMLMPLLGQKLMSREEMNYSSMLDRFYKQIETATIACCYTIGCKLMASNAAMRGQDTTKVT